MPASKVWVTGLTVGAIAAVTVLAVQADKGPHPKASAARPSVSASAHTSTSPKPHATAAPVPASSGTGRRIVYSVGQKRVWLVDASDKAGRTFAVWPGTVIAGWTSRVVGSQSGIGWPSWVAGVSSGRCPAGRPPREAWLAAYARAYASVHQSGRGGR